MLLFSQDKREKTGKGGVMTVALYNENEEERNQLISYLEQCGRKELRQVKVFPYENHVEFCKAVQDGSQVFDLLVIALDGTFSLEVVDIIRQYDSDIKIMWFSDLDFSLRSYEYSVLWFGKKPVDMTAMRKAFKRFLKLSV